MVCSGESFTGFSFMRKYKPSMRKYLRLGISTILIVLAICVKAQTFSQQDSIQALPSNYLDQISSKAKETEHKLDKKSRKTLQQMMKLEKQMKRKLAKTDSLKAVQIFGSTPQKYEELQQRLNSKLRPPYIPSLDTMVSSLKFLQQNPELLSKAKDRAQKLKEALSKVNGLETQFQKAEEIKKFIRERKQFLKEQLGKLGFAKHLRKLNKQVYYYSSQLNEYKAMLKDHKKAEKKAIELLSKTKLFKDFMRKNSQLASLFRLPGEPDDFTSQANLAGLQTRVQVNNLIQQQIASGGPNAQAEFRQNLDNAQSQLNQLKNKITQSGGSSSDDIVPEGFKPNNQKTKGFLNRLELGTNLQTQKATNYFPVTSDIGLSLGYKLNDKSIIGIGASYKMGLGRGWNHIRITQEGVGIRTFIDWKIKGSVWISGGYEQNYKPQLSGVVLASPSGGGREGALWQQSALIGLSKVISLKTKFFTKTKLQLLWDFLSYQQVPQTTSLVFRIGYNF